MPHRAGQDLAPQRIYQCVGGAKNWPHPGDFARRWPISHNLAPGLCDQAIALQADGQ